jgi:aminopeptidase N
MWRHGQEELTAEYVHRFFADLPGTVEKRSGWLLADAAQAFFPMTALADETLAKAQALIDDETLDLSLRRRLVDDADELAHRLAIRRAHPAS